MGRGDIWGNIMNATNTLPVAVLALADWLEENDHPHLANWLRAGAPGPDRETPCLELAGAAPPWLWGPALAALGRLYAVAYAQTEARRDAVAPEADCWAVSEEPHPMRRGEGWRRVHPWGGGEPMSSKWARDSLAAGPFREEWLARAFLGFREAHGRWPG